MLDEEEGVCVCVGGERMDTSEFKPTPSTVKGRHGSGNKGNFESGQNKMKACFCILKDRQCNPLSVTKVGATRGVTVSMSAFLACHQCYCAGSSLAWGLNLRALVCGFF